MRAHDRDSLNIVDHLEQAFEQAQRCGSHALPQIREAIERVIEEIEDPTLRVIMRDDDVDDSDQIKR
jgi:predicted DNA-binding protein